MFVLPLSTKAYLILSLTEVSGFFSILAMKETFFTHHLNLYASSTKEMADLITSLCKNKQKTKVVSTELI